MYVLTFSFVHIILKGTQNPYRINYIMGKHLFMLSHLYKCEYMAGHLRSGFYLRNLKRTLALFLVIVCCIVRFSSPNAESWLMPTRDDKNMGILLEQPFQKFKKEKLQNNYPRPVKKPIYKSRKYMHITSRISKNSPL